MRSHLAASPLDAGPRAGHRAGVPDVLVTVSELAAFYDCSRSTIWRWIARGLVQVERVGPRAGVLVRLPGTLRQLDSLPQRAVVVAAVMRSKGAVPHGDDPHPDHS